MENKKSFIDHLNKMKNSIVSFFQNFAKGDWKTKLSYFIMGSGHFTRGQVIKGLLYLALQVFYFGFMATTGLYYASSLKTLGVNAQGRVWDEANQIYRVIAGDNSMLLLLFGVSTVMISIVFFCLYLLSVKQSVNNEQLIKNGKTPKGFKQDWKDLFNEKFHITVLSIPLLLTFLFTVLPLIFMVAMAFTNYDKTHQPPGNLFTWVGFTNFKDLLWNDPLKSKTFMTLLIWTITWSVFATFLNYVFGMLLAIMINKKGIKFKGMWRTIFVTTIAIPQFVSLLLMSKLLHDQGILNNLLISWGWIDSAIPFLTKGSIAKVVVIVINLWVGIPYSMLITSGILMNIPADLYESAKIDGAGPIVQFFKITLPYMLFVTTPYLITQFIGNINNFNVIYLLTGGDPKSLNLFQAGETDLLVTWLYKQTVTEQNFNLASTIGILIFAISAFFSLVVFNKSNAVQKEDEFQ